MNGNTRSIKQICWFLMSALLMSGKMFGVIPVMNETAGSGLFTVNDQRADWDISAAVWITLSDEGSTIRGNGALNVNAEYRHGIVCNDDLVIAGGSLAVKAVQDGLHANDSVRIRETEISISAGDDGITVSNDDETAFFYMESGKITISSCYEGIEAARIMIADGTLDIMPTDDGINANGSGEHVFVYIAGGEITIINPSGWDADGLDSNGSIYIEGGRVLISVLDRGGNCALDYGRENNGECVISGGTVIACGGSAMAEGFDENSAQGFLMYRTTAEAGTMLRLEDSAGRELLSETIPCSFSSAVLSVPGLNVGDVCRITVGDAQEQVTIDNSSDSGFGMPGRFDRGGMRDDGDRPFPPGGQEPDDRPEEAGPWSDGIREEFDREDFFH